MSTSEIPAIAVETAGGPAAQSSRFWRETVPLIALAVTAVALRLASTRGDLVLDEVWSLRIAVNADSPWQIVVMPVDNNHILNTLVLYALGHDAPFWAYRLPAALASSLALWFAYRLVRRQGIVATSCVLILLGLSQMLILFGTEARGYGYLACCGDSVAVGPAPPRPIGRGHVGSLGRRRRRGVRGTGRRGGFQDRDGDEQHAQNSRHGWARGGDLIVMAGLSIQNPHDLRGG